MEYRWILYKKEGGVATIILNRPRALNALNAGMKIISRLVEGRRAGLSKM